MKNQGSRLNYLTITILLVSLFFPLLTNSAWSTVKVAQSASAPTFITPSVLSSLPNKSVQSIYQDCDGFLWICTRSGLFLYDGHTLTTYKSNLFSPNLLTSNSIMCVAEDSLHRLWIGTANGVNRLDKRTGKVRKFTTEEVNTNVVSQILITRGGRILIGSDNGLFEYQESKDCFVHYTEDNTDGRFPNTPIKSLMQDHRGDLWIGTQNAGLYRYDAENNRLIDYPQMNLQNSAHLVFEDSQHRIWIGAWDIGVQLLHHPYDMERVSWTTYSHNAHDPYSVSDNLIYSLAEDPNTHSLWVGTRSGLSVLPLNSDGVFHNYYAGFTDQSISGSEVATLLADRQGLMWIGMLGGGINCVNTHQPNFILHRLEKVKERFKSNAVRSMLIDRKGRLWVTISTTGFGVIDPATGQFTHYTELGEPELQLVTSSVVQLSQIQSTGNIIVCVFNNGGAFEFAPYAPRGQRLKRVYDNSYFKDASVYDVCEDADGNFWFATHSGITIVPKNNKSQTIRLDSVPCSHDCSDVHTLDAYSINAIVRGTDGEMWAATPGGGILRITGQGADWRQYHVKVYTSENGRICNNFINCIFRDSLGRIWAGTEGGGLALFNRTEDRFRPVHLAWNLPGDAIVSIIEDNSGILWLGSNAGLIRLSVADDAENALFRLFTAADGLQDNIFNRNAAAISPDGELFFGGHCGYNSFRPTEITLQEKPVQFAVTNIQIFDHSWAQLTPDERAGVSLWVPTFTDHITLNHKQNNFTFEFSALDFIYPNGNRYAYKLDGFQHDWVYTDASKRLAFYNNLKPGNYTFHLRASNANGVWNNETRLIQVTILPPPWLTWWAYLIYISIAATISYFIFRTVRNRILLTQTLHRREMEKQTAEELNHAKLQFFTNITHELLTPLAIISASVDELKANAPGHDKQYEVMTANVKRLIKLLQQILEFRKAETGNLKLRVSNADLIQFVRTNIESFRPLMKRKDMEINFVCNIPIFFAYFDPDKLDKILYNLLSNAAKYNQKGEIVTVCLSMEDDGKARLEVADNGPGISKTAQKDLFKRFYEGDYRKFKTIGTGIGLSLTRELVLLHHGVIEVESDEGKGTRFIILLPTQREDYRAEEVDITGVQATETSYTAPDSPAETVRISPKMTEESGAAPQTVDTEAPHYSLLLVEDNEELLALMVKLLQPYYRVFTAIDGAKAQEVLKHEDISLIVSDVMMPIMDGIELCRYVKNTFETSHIPIILLTAKTQEEDRVEAYQSGADAFITKPFELPVLHARIDNLLRLRERHGHDFTKQLVFEAKELDYTSLDEEFLQRAIDCVNRHLDNSNFDLNIFIDELHVSRSTSARKLKSLTGQTFVAFVRNLRMKAAVNLLEEKKDISISELAYAVGYSDPRYFSTTFKKEFGVLPSEYLEKKKTTTITDR